MNTNAANAVTFARIVLSPLLVVVDPYSWVFMVLFAVCGITDVLDGWLARRYHLESEFGGRLDSFADLIMFVALTFVVVANVKIPLTVWAMVAAVVVLKTVSYVIGRRHGFSGFRHSSMNRMTGLTVFVSVPFLLHWDPSATGIIVCSVAIVAALGELAADIRDARCVHEVRIG